MPRGTGGCSAPSCSLHRICYRLTSSVTQMINILEWQTLAKRRRSAWLQMFNKIHYNLVAISMPLQCKWMSSPSRTENNPACCIPASIADYHRLSFFPPVRDWNLLSKNPVSLQECSPKGLVIPQMYSCKPCTHAPVCTRASRPVTEEEQEQEEQEPEVVHGHRGGSRNAQGAGAVNIRKSNLGHLCAI